MIADPMSRAANLTYPDEVARQLGFDERGLAKVRLELLKVPSRRSPDHRN